MPSFDIVSKIDMQELDNALNQARKEITQRFDFRNTGTEVEEKDGAVHMTANAEGRLDAAWEVVSGKLVRRGLPLQAFTRGDVQPAAGAHVKQTVSIQVGIPTDKAKKIVKMIKDTKLKVQPSIQGDSVRVSGKKRDDLQQVIALLKADDSLEIAMQFENFRD